MDDHVKSRPGTAVPLDVLANPEPTSANAGEPLPRRVSSASGVDEDATAPTEGTLPQETAAKATEEANTATSQTDPSSKTITKEPSAPLHSVFSHRWKVFIVFMAGLGAFISPLSTNIYFPALPTLAAYYHVTPTDINLSLTTYMVFQAIAPTFFGDFGDTSGHRPAFVVTLVVYFAANVGLALQSSYPALLVLRALQSTGASGTVALRNGVIAEVFTPAERGVYLGVVQAGGLVAPTFAPLLGGVLTQYLGWRSTFWFLVIVCGVYTVPYLMFQPETNRKIVGNGSIPPANWWNKSGLDFIKGGRQQHFDPEQQELSRGQVQERKKQGIKWPNPWKTLLICKEKDVAILLFFASIVYAALYDIISSTPVIFQRVYGFNDLQVGLCYIPIGVSCAIAAVVTGKLLDRNYARVAKANGFPVQKKRRQNLRHFPIETARLQLVIPSMAVVIVSMIAYGWVLEAETNLAAPLIFQFVIGGFAIAAFTGSSNLLVDLYPESASTVTAASNLTRCMMGAGATALINPMLETLGDGWTFTLIAGICALACPIALVLMKWGPKWREERAVRNDLKQEKKSRLAQERDMGTA